MTRRFTNLFVAMMLVLGLYGSALRAADPQIFWRTNVTEAVNDSIAKNKPLVVQIYREEGAGRAPWCQKFYEETITSPELAVYADQAIYLQVDSTDERSAAKHILDGVKVDQVPFTVVFDVTRERMQEIAHTSGYYARDEFLEAFVPALTKSAEACANRQFLTRDQEQAKVAALRTELLAQADEVGKAAAEWRNELTKAADGLGADAARLDAAYRHWRVEEEKLASLYVGMNAIPSTEAKSFAQLISEMARYEVKLCSKLQDKALNLVRTGDLSQSSVRDELRQIVIAGDQETSSKIEEMKTRLAPIAESFAARYGNGN